MIVSLRNMHRILGHCTTCTITRIKCTIWLNGTLLPLGSNQLIPECVGWMPEKYWISYSFRDKLTIKSNVSIAIILHLHYTCAIQSKCIHNLWLTII